MVMSIVKSLAGLGLHAPAGERFWIKKTPIMAAFCRCSIAGRGLLLKDVLPASEAAIGFGKGSKL